MEHNIGIKNDLSAIINCDGNLEWYIKSVNHQTQSPSP